MNAAENLQIWSLIEKLGCGKGITSASIDLDKDLPACTRLIQKLEKDLGMKLIDHHRRPAQLTNEAIQIIPAVKKLTKAYSELLDAVESVKSEEALITMSIPVNISRSSYRDSIQLYKKLDPKLKIQVLSDLDHQDLLERKADLVCLPYHPPTDGLMVWPCYEARTVLAAAPAYLRKRGVPTSPKDLSDHSLILRASRHYPMTNELHCGSRFVPLNYREIVFSGDVLSGKEALLAGEGISVDLSIFSIEKELKSGLVVQVLPYWSRPAWHVTFAIRRESLSNSRLVKFALWLKEREKTNVASRFDKYRKMGFLR